jgi:hypothetical protein
LSPGQNELLSGVPSLSLLTTAKDFLSEPLTTFWATSSATAQAASMAATLMGYDRSWWPETVRALMVHSASWTQHMRERLEQCAGKNEKLVYLRQFGYGVPDLSRAISSAENDLFMISQAELTPYFRELKHKDEKDSLTAPKYNEMHLYSLPWPIRALQDIGTQDVELKITLSYFIEPNLGDMTSTIPAKYRSCGLRFDLKRRNENEARFLARLNDQARNPDEVQLAPEDDKDWLFGPRSISAGSIHSDTWKGSAATLATRDQIAIVPVGGWWKDRAKAKRYDSKIRYSLIISITSPDHETQLYTEVQQKIEAAIPISIDIQA